MAQARIAHASSIYLKNSSIVTDNVIRLEDIFGGLEENGDKVLGAAPHPGRNITLSARTLLRVALALDLPWRPSGETDHIVIQRAATVIDEGMLKSAVAKKLADEGHVNGSFDVQFTTSGNEMILPHDMPPSAEVLDISYSPQNDWFQVTIVAPSADNPVRRQQLTGAVRKIMEIPVLKDNLRNGDIIRASDLEWLELYAGDIKHDYLLKAEDLVGMTPRRMVMEGKPVREIELEAPRMVKRGDTVTIIYQSGSMQLTAEGRAIRDGAKGDFIRVVNNNSSRTVEGFVTGERVVTVK
jgi:flagella basal body P-ring formation protein FlgA